MKMTNADGFLQWSLIVLFGALTLMTMGLTKLLPLPDWVIRTFGIVVLAALAATAYGFVKAYKEKRGSR